MHIVLTEAQTMLQRSARAFLRQECPQELVRAMETDEQGYAPHLWQRLAELGWLAWPFPARYGGADGDFFELALLAEELGYAAASTPFFSSVVQAGLTLLEAGSEARKQELLPRVSTGDLLLSLAYLEPDGVLDALHCKTVAATRGDGFVLHGSKCLVPDAHIAERLLCTARVQTGHASPRGLSLFLIEPHQSSVQLRPMVTTAGDKQFEVGLHSVEVGADALVGAMHQAGPPLRRALLRATALKCAEMVGGARAVLDMTLEYVKQRVQFGRPIGSFQAVQHHCADMYRDLEMGRLLAYQACWNLARNLPAEAAVAAAKLKLSKAYPEITRLAHQMTGGVGYYTEYPLELYTRRALAAAGAFGGPADHARHLADLLWGPA
jgi:alkylation response protein AidB-like acyl-CoA dehydrogenase